MACAGHVHVHVHGVCMACVWHVHGVCMACAWRVHGVCMACAWRVHGMCVASEVCSRGGVQELAAYVSSQGHRSVHTRRTQYRAMNLLTYYGHTCTRSSSPAVRCASSSATCEVSCA